MGEFNDSPSNRCFAVFLSILLMIPTGWGLFTYFAHDSSRDKQDWLSRTLVHIGMDVVGAAFVLSCLALIWAMFMPAWLGRVLRFTKDHFIVALAMLPGLFLLMLVFAWITLYVN